MTYIKMMTVFGLVIAAGSGDALMARAEPNQEQPAKKDEVVRFQQPNNPKNKDLEELGLDPFIVALDLDPVIIGALKLRPNDSPLRKLQRERCRSRAVFMGIIKNRIEFGNKWNPQDFSETLKAPDLLASNLLELMEKSEDKLKCYELRLSFLKMMEQFTDNRVKVGSDPSQNGNIATAARIDAEIDLLRFKDEMAKAKK
jgi:hypothetical protein